MSTPSKDGPSPVAMVIGGLVALVVGWMFLRWVLGTIFFFARMAVLAVIVVLVLSAVARMTGRSKK